MEMWKYRVLGSVAALLLLLAVVVPFTQTQTQDKAAMAEDAGPLMGGIEDSPMGQENDLDVIALARFAVSEHNNKANALLEFENVVKLKKQTVAGTILRSSSRCRTLQLHKARPNFARICRYGVDL
ncbi:hypothetical protein ZWY2020_030375 [Hordeum vulgare]|nr:hypothetical protein ZWY2020_030375 [Hordeum vulgare]